MDIYEVLLKTPLFVGFSTVELKMLLPALQPIEKKFEKGHYLLYSGGNVTQIGILLDGTAEAFRNTADGTKITVANLGVGSVFGDVLGGSTVTSPVNVLTTSEASALFIPYDNLLGLETQSRNVRRKLVQNLLRSVSNKYFELSFRVDILLVKSIRQKMAIYLLHQAQATGNDTFFIPFNRVKLAGYLGCERSALSRELGLMVKDGLIETYKQSFKLLNKKELLKISEQ